MASQNPPPQQQLSCSHQNEILQRLSVVFPAPQTELEFTNPYTLLVAVTLSAQSTDRGVNKATRILFQYVQTPQDMLALGEERLIDLIQTIGLYRSKARYLMQAASLLQSHFEGQVPRTREELESLPGVGRKTANVILNVAFGQPTIAVDTHIFRVCNRTGLAPGKTPLAVELALEKSTPDEDKLDLHHRLLLHGRYICKAQKPLCSQCRLQDLCLFFQGIQGKV